MSETKLEDLSSAYCPRCGEPELEYGNCKYCDYPEPAASPSPPAGVEGYDRALNCAAEQFEGYVRRNEVTTSAERRKALDDALQHAIGILALAPPAGEWPSEEGEEILSDLLSSCRCTEIACGACKIASYINRLHRVLKKDTADHSLTANSEAKP